MPDTESIRYRRLGSAGYYATVSRLAIVLLFFVIGIFALLLYRRREVFMGPDHLLTVETNGYTEKYRFFNFADIQAITVRGNSMFMTWIVMLTLFCASFIFIGSQIGDSVGWIVFGTLSGILGIALLVHIVKGPTVDCKLKTAVSEIELPSLGRLNQARACIAEIQSHVEKTQGRLEASDIAERMQRARDTTANVSAAPASSTPAATLEPATSPESNAQDDDQQDSGNTF
ncbi:MAG: hypothetical protein ACPGVU_01055 [Limisphaerales bacterium]